MASIPPDRAPDETPPDRTPAETPPKETPSEVPDQRPDEIEQPEPDTDHPDYTGPEILPPD